MIANLPECVALPLDHPYANNDILDMRDLKNEKFIAMARSISCSGFESIIQKSLAAGFEAQIVAQVDLLPTLMTMVACGQGISDSAPGHAAAQQWAYCICAAAQCFLLPPLADVGHQQR